MVVIHLFTLRIFIYHQIYIFYYGKNHHPFVALRVEKEEKIGWIHFLVLIERFACKVTESFASVLTHGYVEVFANPSTTHKASNVEERNTKNENKNQTLHSSKQLK